MVGEDAQEKNGLVQNSLGRVFTHDNPGENLGTVSLIEGGGS